MDEMDAYPLWITLIVLAGIVIGLMREHPGPEIVLLTGLAVLLCTGVLTVDEALRGFSSSTVIALGSLFAIGAGLRGTGAMEYLGRLLLGPPRPNQSLVRMTAPIAGLSAFLNNIPLVAIFLPVFVDRAKRMRVSPSRLLLPLSYAAIMGGTCSLIGTSTNLIVDEVMRDRGLAGLAMFEMAWIGVPVVVIGMLYLATIGRRLLPDRQDLLERMVANPRQYTVEMMVQPQCTLVGRSVAESGLRDHPGLYLYRIERSGRTIAPVDPKERIHAGDLLVFSGIVSTVVELQKIRGLVPVEHRVFDTARIHDWMAKFASLDSMEGIPPEALAPAPAPRTGPLLCEAVISSASPLVGLSIRQSNFRSRYDASIIAVHRSGHKLERKIGRIVLQAGDTLLVDAGKDFLDRWRNSPDFILVSGIEDSAPVAHERTFTALVIFGLVVLGLSLPLEGRPALPALLGAVVMVLFGCVGTREVHRAVELPVLVLVAASLGIGEAMKKSGAAGWLAEGILSISRAGGDHTVLAAVFFATCLLSQFLSNQATAALMASLAFATAEQYGLDPRPLLIAVALAASTAFATPVGYQTNLMVREAGGYRFLDYVRVGLPLTLIVWLLAVLLIPQFWSLRG